MRYGVPYQGSKNSIAREIVEFLPSADTLIDICAGGCAITHAALELCEGFAPKWRHIISNDINPIPGRLFRDAIDGKYAHETRWISREDFHRLKASDPYVRTAGASATTQTIICIRRKRNRGSAPCISRAFWGIEARCVNLESTATEVQRTSGHMQMSTWTNTLDG